jgi:hypothetical protein
MVVGIGDIQLAIGHTNSARLIERGVRTVSLSALSRPGKSSYHPGFGIQQLDPVIVGIGDQHAAIEKRQAQGML